MNPRFPATPCLRFALEFGTIAGLFVLAAFAIGATP